MINPTRTTSSTTCRPPNANIAFSICAFFVLTVAEYLRPANCLCLLAAVVKTSAASFASAGGRTPQRPRHLRRPPLALADQIGIVEATSRGRSSVGRAARSQCAGQGFESPRLQSVQFRRAVLFAISRLLRSLRPRGVENVA